MCGGYSETSKNGLQDEDHSAPAVGAGERRAEPSDVGVERAVDALHDGAGERTSGDERGGHVARPRREEQREEGGQGGQ